MHAHTRKMQTSMKPTVSQLSVFVRCEQSQQKGVSVETSDPPLPMLKDLVPLDPAVLYRNTHSTLTP